MIHAVATKCIRYNRNTAKNILILKIFKAKYRFIQENNSLHSLKTDYNRAAAPLEKESFLKLTNGFSWRHSDSRQRI